MFRGGNTIRKRAETAPPPSPHAAVHIGLVGSDYSGKTELLNTLLNHRNQPNTAQDYVLPANDEMPAQPTQLVDIPGSPEEEFLKWCDWSECFVLCFSVSSRETYEEIIKVRESIRKAKRTKNIPTLVIGTSFAVKPRCVEYDEANKLAKELNFHYTEVSRNAFHISEAVRIIVNLAIQSRNTNTTEGRGTLRGRPHTENVPSDKRSQLQAEVSSFEKWNATLDQIAKRVTQNPQQFVNKAGALRNFLEEEHAYCERLNLALKIFLSPLKKGEPEILKRKNLQKIFRNIEVIVEQSINLVNAMDRRVFEEWQTGNDSVGDLFERLDTIIKLNASYLQHHISSMTCVNNMEKKNVNFADFLQRANASQEAVSKKLDFVSFLLMPVERLRKYERVLEAMQTHTPETHPDFKILIRVADSIASTRNIIQTKIEENFQTVFAIQRSFVGDFVIAKDHNYFITDGGLYKVCKSGERKLRWFFLFNDTLVYATVIPAPTLPITHDSAFHSKNISSLSLQPYHGNVYAISRKITLGIACKIVDMTTSSGFKIISVEKTFVVFADSMTEKKKWLEHFHTVLSEESIVMDGRSESTYQLSAVARASVKIKQCMMCTNVIHDKHYCCRNCGKVICAACSTKRYRISHFGDDSTVRVCDYCHQYLSLSMSDTDTSAPSSKKPTVKFSDAGGGGDAPQPEDQSSKEKHKSASLVGYSLKKMRNVGQFVKRKTQVLDLFKRKKPTQVNKPDAQRPTNVTIGHPMVNTNVVVIANPITTQYNQALQTPHPTVSPPLKPVSVVPNHGVFINSRSTVSKRDVRNSITPEDAVHLEQNLKLKIANINQAIQQKQQGPGAKPPAYFPRPPTLTEPPPPPRPPPGSIPHPPSIPPYQPPEPSPPKPSPSKPVTYSSKKAPASEPSPLSLSPPSSAPSPRNTPASPPPSRPPPSTSPPKNAAAPPKHVPPPRRYGVKLDSFSSLDPADLPQSTSPPSSTQSQPKSSQASPAHLQPQVAKKKPEAPSKPLPARPPGGISKSPAITSTSTSPPSSTSQIKPSAVINPNSLNLWKCLPDEPSPTSLAPTPSKTGAKQPTHIPPSRPPPPPPRNVISPTRDRSETLPVVSAPPPTPQRNVPPRPVGGGVGKEGANGTPTGRPPPVRPPRTASHLTYPRRQGSGNKFTDDA